MKINGIFILAIIVLTIFVNNHLSRAETNTQDYAGESIQYLISPLGRSEYSNLGIVDLKGIKVNLVIL